MLSQELFTTDPGALTEARHLCHAACQWPSRAARSNLLALPDDSHAALCGQPLVGSSTLAFRFAPATLMWVSEVGVEDTLPLAGMANADVGTWVDATLGARGLAPATAADMPYTLDPVDYHGFDAAADAAATLGAWYREAHTALQNAVAVFADHAVAEPVVRCWPHHFDIAVLFALEEGDPETAASIGVGLSPGDEAYAEPYLYCTPWPRPDEPGTAPEPMTWHTAGFTSLVVTASRLGPDDDLDSIVAGAVAFLLEG